MNTQHPNLSYEFYYLLRTEFELNGSLRQEPPSLSNLQNPSVTEDGIPVDSDKRLFRLSTHSLPLEKWPVFQNCGWRNILACYTRHFAGDGVRADFFCSHALLGIAMLICDADMSDLAKHKVRIPLEGKGHIVPDEAVFELVPENSSGRELLKVFHEPDDGSEQMPGPACLTAFRPQFSTRHYRIEPGSSDSRLVPMQTVPDAPNPVFEVYGLAHGDVIRAEARKAAWPCELQNFMEGEDAALLVRILPHLITRRWQFSRMDMAAHDMRRLLREKCAARSETDAAELRCMPGHKLSEGLQDMADLQAHAKEVSGQLEKAVKTLEVHRNNTERRLKRADRHDPRWRVVWQNEDEAPIPDRFNAGVRNLQNHIDYIRGDRTALDGIRDRWRLHFEERRLVLNEQLAISASVLTIIAAIATIFTILPESLVLPLKHLFTDWQAQYRTVRFLSHPVVLLVSVFLVLWPVLWFLIRTVARKGRFWWSRLKQLHKN